MKLHVTSFPSLDQSTGTPHERSWTELSDKLARHVAGPKPGALFNLTRLRGNHRSNADVLVLHGIVLDVEQRNAVINKKTEEVRRPAGPIPPPLEEVSGWLYVLGVRAILYTSHSHTPELPRYRIVVPLDRPISVDELRAAGERDFYEAFAGSLGLAEVCDTGKWSASACFNLPRADADRMAQAQAAVIEGAPADAGRFLAGARAIGAKRDAERAEAEAAVIARDGAKIRRTGTGAKLIERIRDAMPPMAEVLVSHGYAYHPAKKRFLSPHSSSGQPGVVILVGVDGVERMVSHHESDELNHGNVVFGARAHDVVDVEIAEVYGTTDDARRKGLYELAKQFGIGDDPGDDWGVDGDAPEPEPAPEPDTAPETDPEDQAGLHADLELLARKVPAIDPCAFYGPLAEIVEAATANSEATKVGVASHLITSLACIAARPFFIQISDERLGLNIFTLQVGQSAKGRKGTSEAFSKRHLIPGFVARAELMAAGIDDDNRAAAGAARGAQQSQAKIDALVGRIERLSTMTPESIEEALAGLADLQEELDREKVYRESYAGRLKDTAKPLSPASVEKYEKGVLAADCNIGGLAHQIDAIKLAHAQMLSDYEARDTLGVTLQAELVKARNTHNDDLHRAAVLGNKAAKREAWLDHFMVMAERPSVLTGIASGAGIVDKIRDPSTIMINGKPVDVAGVDDKRLLINLSEFGSVLSAVQSGRQVSEIWRQMWDCAPLDLGAKTTPTSCQEPFVCVSGSITPAELTGLLFDPKDQARSADNGFANRHLFLFVNREKLVADPKQTEGAERLIGVLFENVLKVYSELQPREPHLSTEYAFSPDGLARWYELYEEIDQLEGAGTNASKLFGRMTTNVRKLAPVLALLNGEATVGAAAVDAAWAWVRYSADTVNAIAASAQERQASLKMSSDVALVVAVLREEGADVGICVRRRDVVRQSKLPVKRVTAAIGVMQSKSPAWVEVVSERVAIGNGAKREVVSFLLTKWAPD